MFGFIKKVFFTAVTYFSCNPLSLNSLKCVSLNNQECKIRLKIIDITIINLYLFNIKVNKCSGSCNNINSPYAKLCVPDVVKNKNVKVCNLMKQDA